MPIVTVEIVGGERQAPVSLAQQIADAVAQVTKSAAGQTWVRVRWLSRGSYAENGPLPDGDELPIFVSVLERAPPIGRELEAEVSAIAGAIAQVVGRRTDCVHIEYAPAAAGRMAFGGKLVQ